MNRGEIEDLLSELKNIKIVVEMALRSLHSRTILLPELALANVELGQVKARTEKLITAVEAAYARED